MNREERRRAARRRQTTHTVRTLTDSYACPDCLAHKQLVEQAPGVYVLTVMHDATCPMYRAMRSEQ